ncbi:MAG: protein phosphatase/cyclic nucleotide-binding domain-containing protein [Limisphaerales bacterium]|nr:MAG: protein phosphatase/cyclic nucleotide-binding domain-containing protein [Limisphaerales bacterium]KAG0510426.1 MAG: protein phosphatase/cyclic nucleotide-binding domain-containing protein [Limisphaerales bacterium]
MQVQVLPCAPKFSTRPVEAGSARHLIMAANIRKAVTEDAASWIQLVKATLGEDHPNKQVYDPAWVAAELASGLPGNETWVAEEGGKIQASISVLGAVTANENPVCNLGRNLFHPSSYADGAAEALLGKVTELAVLRRQMCVTRVLASDNPQQVLIEKTGFVCVGFQPLKHITKTREEVLFYVKRARSMASNRLPLSESLPQIGELAAAVLQHLVIPGAPAIRDGGTGYPLQTDVVISPASEDDYKAAREAAAAQNPPQEISSNFNWGTGFMRVSAAMALRAVLSHREGKVVAGMRYLYDEQDRCVRVMEAFCTDNLSLGAVLQHVTKAAQAELSAAYVEMDVLTSSVKLLISAEQLGFVPAAYLPGFHKVHDGTMDLVKMVKLNQTYSIEHDKLTAHALTIVNVIKHCLQDQSIGVAIINLLRDLELFKGLGDGELRKVARLFTQKLFRPGEKIFGKDDQGHEAYVVMRGQIDILLEENTAPIATLGQGQVFGELSFLDGGKRGALAIAKQASILLVMQRPQFFEMTQREPNLGLAVMRNIALELTVRLRRTNAALSAKK